jgi:exodeoxyribonuclease-3
MRIATWNVNSIKARLPRLLAWLERQKPDVLCLQELKTMDEKFPAGEIVAAGYHALAHGQKTYNGVAILARAQLSEEARGMDDGVEDPQARLIAAQVAGVRILSVYVPNGAEIGSEKWAYKLEWLARLRRFLERRYAPSDPLVVCGDLNIAPEARDVHDPAAWEGTVLFHPAVRASFKEITTWGLADTLRMHHSEGGLYTWWDYRMLAFPKNLGLRIDHILASPPMASKCVSVAIDRQERKGKLPSDHAPVIAAFDWP